MGCWIEAFHHKHKGFQFYGVVLQHGGIVLKTGAGGGVQLVAPLASPCFNPAHYWMWSIELIRRFYLNKPLFFMYIYMYS